MRQVAPPNNFFLDCRLTAPTGSFRAFFQSSPTSHHVITTTREAALLWDYNSSILAPIPRILNLAQPLKNNEPLPIASLAITGTSSDVGIVIVHPNTGKILYKENLDSVDSLSLFQRNRQGVEGVFKLMSGETVVDVIDVKDAGYVLMLSSGRLAHLTVRDQQGRPLISVSQMNSDGLNKGSWFGSFSSILGGGWKNTIAAVKTRPSYGSGQMEVVATTVEGTFKLWNVSHDGQNMFKTQIESLEEIRHGLVTAELISAVGKVSIQVKDFAILQHSSRSVVNQHGPAGLNLVVLVAYEEQVTTRYALLYITLSGDKPILTRLTPIIAYNSPASDIKKEIRLLVPHQEHTAFLVASNAVVVASLLAVNKSDVAEIQTPPFQDVIYFHDDKGAEIVSSSIEAPRASSRSDDRYASSILLFTQGYGAVRIAAGPCSKSADRQKVSAKSKIEQAVFFGKLPNNILNLTELSAFSFSTREAELAAVQISQEILQSTSEFIPHVMSSLDSQINKRIKALHDLIVFMRDTFSPLSRYVKWHLLLDAERMASALALWHMHERWLSKRKNKEETMLHQYLEAINERNKKELVKEEGEVDPVREWFTKDMNRIEKLFTLIPSVNKEQSGEASDLHDMIEDMLEAYDIFGAGLQTAFDFRARNIGVYGLDEEPLENGILRSNYEGLPEMWTARMNTMNSVSKSVRAFGEKTITLRALLGTEKGPDKAQVAALSKAYPKLVMLSCLTYTERARWLLVQDSEEAHASGERIMDQFVSEIRPQQLSRTAEVGQAFAGMDVAEKLHDMKSLVDLILNELELAPDDEELKRLTHKGQIRAEKQAKDLSERIEGYFKKFGEKFARAFFTAHVRNGQLADLLEKNYGKGKQLTEFLRSNTEYFKLCWINDVTAEKDLLSAGKALMTVAKDKELNIWSKHAELSIAKLSLLASKTTSSMLLPDGSLVTAGNSSGAEEVADILLMKNKSERQIAKIQEDLYNHLKPTYTSGLNDTEGKVNAVMEYFGKGVVEDRPALQWLLRQGFETLYNQEVLTIPVLIDILTLMDCVSSATEDDASTDIAGQEFLMALRVLDASGWCDSLKDEERERGEMLKRLIWKRLFIRDNWEEVNNTKGKSDKESKERVKETLLYDTLKDGLLECKCHHPPVFLTYVANGVTVIWELDYSAKSPAYTIPAPADVVGAASSPEDLEWRFPGHDTDLRNKIALDNARDDEILNTCLSTLRMGFHFDAARDVAYEVVKQDYEDRAAAEDQLRQFVAGYEVPEIKDRGLVERSFVMQEGEYEGGEYDDESPISSPKQLRRRLARGESFDGEDVDQKMEERDGYEEETEEE
jgi:nuclear pore complex protein Nup133